MNTSSREKGLPVGVVMQNAENIPPQNDVMEYLVIRDEKVSVVTMNGYRYEFERNEHGHKVCKIPNKGTRALMIESGNFREYVPPADEKPQEVPPFIKRWNKLSAEKFVRFVRENIQLFAECDAETLEKAKAKWAKMNGDEPWPGDKCEEPSMN